MEKIGNYVMIDALMYLPVNWAWGANTQFSVEEQFLVVHRNNLRYTFEGDGIIRISDGYGNSECYDTHAYYAATCSPDQISQHLTDMFLKKHPAVSA